LKPISQRATHLQPSVTVAIDTIAKKMKQDGVHVLSMGAGEPDFPTPEPICEAGIASIQNGLTRYSAPGGIQELKVAICEKLKNDNNLHYTPENIIVCSGAKHAINNALAALVDPGDEVLIPAPYWVTYPELVRFYGGVPVIVPTLPEHDFVLQPTQLQQAITPKTKLVLLNSPNNPTGTVYSKSILEQLAQVMIQNDLYCISDEIYEYMVYDDAMHHSIAALHKDMPNRTVVVNGVSKAYCMTGWRAGYAAGPTNIIAQMIKIQGQCTHHPSNIAQYAAINAIQNEQSSVSTMQLELSKRRQYVISRLQAIPQSIPYHPAGAFYIFVNIAHIVSNLDEKSTALTSKDSLGICEYLLQNYLVATIPGSAFGMEHYIRLSYTLGQPHLEAAMDAFINGLLSLYNTKGNGV
jgi:aspartate aminotransferase